MNSTKQLRLSLNEKLFVKYYLFGSKEFRLGNGTKAYAKAYNRDIKDKKVYNICSVNALTCLRNSKIKEYIATVLEESGFNDHIVDAKLLDILKNGDNKESLGAIKEYNNLRARITQKHELINPVNITVTRGDDTKRSGCVSGADSPVAQVSSEGVE
ncbi:hypothetical protein LCGC14_3050130 [marine sediment metagenome]|uniref:Terminase small subunit n=1 Tax=marine sediment metagenome TaxID=412755 RepID=A0A0F8ZCY3_9ZZZZ|nr:hypothetical protein [Candidatus Scalindua sp.]